MKRPDEDIRQELEELSPHLLQLKEQAEGFSVPPQFFEHLQNTVWEKIQAPEAPVSAPARSGSQWRQELWAQIQVLRQPRWALSLATVLLLVWGAIALYQNAVSPSATLSTQLASVDPAALNQYIKDNLDEFDTETLLEFAASPENSARFEHLTPEELQQYLNEVIQEMDVETLQELL
jgi:hypothetical protein